MKLNNYIHRHLQIFNQYIMIMNWRLYIIIMRNRIFVPLNQKLSTIIPFIEPKLKLLRQLVPESAKLNKQIQQFCLETYVLENNNSPLSHDACQQAQNFTDILNQNVRQLLLSNNQNYIQCFGQQYKDYSLHCKNLNFGKTILQSSPCLQKLSNILGSKWTKKLIYEYAIFMKYEDQYFQVSGVSLPDTLKKINEKKKKVGTKYSYSSELINRFQMLYCSHTNRNSGLFRKNIFFDKGLTKSNFYQQVKLLTQKQVQLMLPGQLLKQKQKQQLQSLIFIFFNKVRDLFEIKKVGGKNVCQFDSMLTRYCALPSFYQEMKKDVNIYLKSSEGQSEKLFQRLYSAQSLYESVYQLLKKVVIKTFPLKLLGDQNTHILLPMLKQFVCMKRYQNYKVQDFLNKMNVFSVSWLCINYNKKYKKQIIGRCKKIMASIICMLFNKLLIPILKLNFYITQKHKQANKLFYYRKPIWVLVSKLALKKFSQVNLQNISQAQYLQIKKSGTDYPEGKLRLMPKKGTFRPIITFNRKRKVQGDFYKATLNQILSDTQLVLRNLKNILGTDIGYCIFDNKQISKKYDDFITRWRNKGQPKLVYFTLDIRKCYDSIDTGKLVQIIQNTPYIEHVYLLIKYMRLYRNKRPITQKGTFNNYFNIKERVHATSLVNDPIKIYEDKIPSINVFLARQKMITRQQIIKKLKQLCDGSIIRYKNQIWLQKLGIPQGLNVSGVLCSLYFAYLQDQFVKVTDGLLMRLTDDYLYIGPQKQAVNVLTSLLQCARNNNFVFNSQKINKNFVHPLVQKISEQPNFIHWIGKRININTLEIFPAFDEGSDKLAFAMNVNLNRKQIKGFLKNKLKSLLTNHFAAYFKPHIYKMETQIQNIRLYCRISLSKFFPFLISFHALKMQNESHIIQKILQSTIHQFLIYACSFHAQPERHYFYHKYFQVVLEQFVLFMKTKRTYNFMICVQRAFRQRLKRLTKQILAYQQTHIKNGAFIT